MIATAKSISYGIAKAEYDENKVINGVKVASEAARQNVYGDNCREVVEEMTDVQRIHSPVKNPFLDIVMTLSEEDCEKITAHNQSEWLVNLFMHDMMTEQVGLSEEEYVQMQWIAYEHEHTDNSDSLRHWHILVNRTLLDGRLVSDSWIGKKAAATANKISREYGLTDATVRSVENNNDVFQAAGVVLGNMRLYDFDRYLEGMNALGYSTRLALNSKGEVQGYYITAQSGREYKASAVDRRLTIGRLAALHAELHKDMKAAAARSPGKSFSMPPPNVPMGNVENLLRVFKADAVISYSAPPPPNGRQRRGKRWEDMTDDEKRLAASGMSM